MNDCLGDGEMGRREKERVYINPLLRGLLSLISVILCCSARGDSADLHACWGWCHELRAPHIHPHPPPFVRGAALLSHPLYDFAFTCVLLPFTSITLCSSLCSRFSLLSLDDPLHVSFLCLFLRPPSPFQLFLHQAGDFCTSTEPTVVLMLFQFHQNLLGLRGCMRARL